MNRFVVGVDGSPAATAAAQWAACEAAMRSVELTVVHVLQAAPEVLLQTGWPGRRAVELVAVHATDHAERTEAEKLLARRLAEYQHRYPNVTVRPWIVGAHPADALLDQSQRAQLVVVGSRGRGGLAGKVLGSISAAVVQASRIPVIVAGRPGSVLQLRHRNLANRQRCRLP